MPEPIEALGPMIRAAAEAGGVRFKTAMKEVAFRIEEEMAQRAGEGGSHKYGTPTPAKHGRGPAVISGDLRRSIATKEVKEGWRIGPANIPHTQYASRRGGRGTGGKATAGEIGGYLEPNFPFVGPALDAVKDKIEGIVRDEFDKAPL